MRWLTVTWNQRINSLLATLNDTRAEGCIGRRLIQVLCCIVPNVTRFNNVYAMSYNKRRGKKQMLQDICYIYCISCYLVTESFPVQPTNTERNHWCIYGSFKERNCWSRESINQFHLSDNLQLSIKNQHCLYKCDLKNKSLLFGLCAMAAFFQ